MKQAYITLLTVLGLATFGIAGVTSSGKAPVGGKGVVPPPPPAGCTCFDPGGQFSLYGAALVGANDLEDKLGVGLSAGYFFNPYVGVEADATWIFETSEVQLFTASLVARYPITSACIAPYAFIGGGVHTNSHTQGVYHVGAGFDFRLKSCMGFFADARYTFADKTDDYVLIRAGIRMNF
jgi:opacity protein-like surface antigen